MDFDLSCNYNCVQIHLYLDIFNKIQNYPCYQLVLPVIF